MYLHWWKTIPEWVSAPESVFPCWRRSSCWWWNCRRDIWSGQGTRRRFCHRIWLNGRDWSISSRNKATWIIYIKEFFGWKIEGFHSNSLYACPRIDRILRKRETTLIDTECEGINYLRLCPWANGMSPVTTKMTAALATWYGMAIGLDSVPDWQAKELTAVK